MTTDVDICNRALQMCAARSTITSLADGSNEANNCTLLFDSIRAQILAASNWNFSKSTANLQLLKAAPGTPESPYAGFVQWNTSFPAPPWLYEYLYPANCARIQYVMGQLSPYYPLTPIFSTPSASYTAMGQAPVRYSRAMDSAVGPTALVTGISQAVAAVVTATAHGFSSGQTVYLTSVTGMTQINNQNYVITVINANSFSIPVDSTGFQPYISGGVAVNQTLPAASKRVILTNGPSAIATYAADVTDYDIWEEDAIQAFISALAGYLAIPLSGNRALANDLIQNANSTLMNARADDANEALTIHNPIPDWLAIRWENDYGYDNDAYIGNAYGPLFSGV